MITGHKACSVPDCEGNSHFSAGGARGMCYKHDYRSKKYGSPTGGRTFVGAPRAYLDHYLAESEDTDECVFWPFAKNSAGYGHLLISGKNILVHRLVCSEIHGPEPEGKPYVAHSCGNGHLSCMNKNHLRWASAAENTADAVEHGTAGFRGSNCHWSKLTEAMAFEVLISEAPATRWASVLGVSSSTITAIRRRQTWRHVLS